MTQDIAQASGIDAEEQERFVFHCITCSDQALPFLVVSVDVASCLATVAVGKATEEVDISLLDDVTPGDTLLVHGGVALMRVSDHRESSHQSEFEEDNSQ